MINLEELLKADIEKIARMMCYLSYDCERCPVKELEGSDPSLEKCRRKLRQWLMSQRDGRFWDYI